MLLRLRHRSLERLDDYTKCGPRLIFGAFELVHKRLREMKPLYEEITKAKDFHLASPAETWIFGVHKRY